MGTASFWTRLNQISSLHFQNVCGLLQLIKANFHVMFVEKDIVFVFHYL